MRSVSTPLSILRELGKVIPPPPCFPGRKKKGNDSCPFHFKRLVSIWRKGRGVRLFWFHW